MSRDPWNVCVVAYDGLCIFEFGIMVELFGLPRPEFSPWYSLRVCGVEKGPLRASGGVLLEVPRSLRVLDRAGTIILPGWRPPLTEVPGTLLNKLRRAHAEGARILSVCSGAFLLAATGLLDGRRITTHWAYAERLAEAYPEVQVDPDVLYVDEGQLLSSAGSAAGIDLGLHLIRRDNGTQVANAVARRLVVPPHREGGQQQFIESPVERSGSEGGFAGFLEELLQRLGEEHTVATMAGEVHMSPRNFARRFKEATGTTPHRWLARARVQRAQAILETEDWNLDTIANEVGFTDAQLLRLHFGKVTGTTPSRYRKAFRADRV